jgi:hypothetical protein
MGAAHSHVAAPVRFLWSLFSSPARFILFIIVVQFAFPLLVPA